MMIEITNSWQLLTIAIGLMLLLTFCMSLLSEHFYTNDVVIKKFNIMQLQLPATAEEFVRILSGLYLMIPRKSKKAVRSLRLHLLTDFLCMPFAYGAIFILCMKVASHLHSEISRILFITLAWLQLLAWLCDIIENIYVLTKIKEEIKPSPPAVHETVFIITIIKWVCALTATVSAIGCIAYFWLSGIYNPDTLLYIGLITAELFAFWLLIKFLVKDKSHLYTIK